MCQQYPDSGGTLPFIDFTSDEINAPPAKPNIGTDFTDALETKQEVMNTTVISGYKRSASQQESSSNFRYVTIKSIRWKIFYIPTDCNILLYYLRNMETTCNSGPPVKKAKSNSVQSACGDKNPVMILNELRTGLKYECTELGDTPTTKRYILCHYSIVQSPFNTLTFYFSHLMYPLYYTIQVYNDRTC